MISKDKEIKYVHLLDGIRLEKPINQITLNHDSGLLSKWIKKSQIVYKKNDTSTVRGYMSRVSRGVDHRIEVYNPDTGKRLIIEIEDKNLNWQQSLETFWKIQFNFSDDADIKIDVTNKSLLGKSTIKWMEENGIEIIDTKKKLIQDSEMYDPEWRNSIREQFLPLYYKIKAFMEEKKPVFMYNSVIDSVLDYYYNSHISTVNVLEDSILLDNVYLDRYKTDSIDSNQLKYTNQYSYNKYTIDNEYNKQYNNYTKGFDTPKRLIWALVLCNDNI